jgi:hypothetical protein
LIPPKVQSPPAQIQAPSAGCCPCLTSLTRLITPWNALVLLLAPLVAELLLCGVVRPTGFVTPLRLSTVLIAGP